MRQEIPHAMVCCRLFPLMARRYDKNMKLDKLLNKPLRPLIELARH